MAYKIISKKGRKIADVRYYGAKGGYAYGTKKEAEFIKKLMKKEDPKRFKRERVKLVVKKV